MSMNAITQMALNAITSLSKFWIRFHPEGALADLKRIRDAAIQAIAGVEEIVQERQAAEQMDSEGGVFHTNYVEQER